MKKIFALERGFALPLGCTVLNEGINFSLFSRHADKVTLVIEIPAISAGVQVVRIQLDPELNRTGDLWHILLATDCRDLHYGFQIGGANTPPINGLAYNDRLMLLDPACQLLRHTHWGTTSDDPGRPRCGIIHHDFDWENDRPLKIPLHESVIYELHVRGFTRHPSSGVNSPGTYLGVMEKIPYLCKLGITAVELMPVTEFDENDNTFINPQSGEKLKNFWGYNPISFFALKSGYAANPANHINEFKAMVKALHQAGIEVILDMVLNHTGEGGYQGSTTSFRGIDNPIYYLLDSNTREYLNFSGCGNTLNCNHPVVRELILKALRYWVMEMHIDGFRFDLASILGRDSKGHPLANPPMIEMIAEDPVLRDTKIIAEAWDAAGLYQVGSFSTDARWAEWNGRFRDDVRSFMAGHEGSVANLATRIAGSSDLYQSSSRHPFNSINFITSHDGFTLVDLVSYDTKHNQANGEDNRDGDNHNLSWNSGAEGPTDDPAIQELRLRRMRSMILLLMLSQGVPMIQAGDEFSHSKQGNNNSWCQDNDINWLDWSLVKSNGDMLRFFQQCIKLRKSHPLFQRTSFFDGTADPACATFHSAITWQSLRPCEQDWSSSCHTLGFLLNGNLAETQDDHFFVMVNGHRTQTAIFTLPPIPEGDATRWHQIIDTSASPTKKLPPPSRAPRKKPGSVLEVQPMGAIVLCAPA